MSHPIGLQPAISTSAFAPRAFLALSAMLAAAPLRAADAHPSAAPARKASGAAAPRTVPAPEAGSQAAPSPSSAAAAADAAAGRGEAAGGQGSAQVSPGPSSAPESAAGAKPPGSAARAAGRAGRPPAPLKRLRYSARDGFALRMISEQEVTAEIRNGAGRTLAFTSRTLEPGDWTLRPRNLAPGLYTVLLRTGPNLRALRMKIEHAERPGGLPEWVLEKSADSADNKRMPMALPRGAEAACAPVPVPAVVSAARYTGVSPSRPASGGPRAASAFPGGPMAPAPKPAGAFPSE